MEVFKLLTLILILVFKPNKKFKQLFVIPVVIPNCVARRLAFTLLKRTSLTLNAPTPKVLLPVMVCMEVLST